MPFNLAMSIESSSVDKGCTLFESYKKKVETRLRGGYSRALQTLRETLRCILFEGRIVEDC